MWIGGWTLCSLEVPGCENANKIIIFSFEGVPKSTETSRPGNCIRKVPQPWSNGARYFSA